MADLHQAKHDSFPHVRVPIRHLLRQRVRQAQQVVHLLRVQCLALPQPRVDGLNLALDHAQHCLQPRGLLCSYQGTHRARRKVEARVGSQSFQQLFRFLIDEDLVLLLHEWGVGLQDRPEKFLAQSLGRFVGGYTVKVKLHVDLGPLPEVSGRAVGVRCTVRVGRAQAYKKS